jgi:hypothetical protein
MGILASYPSHNIPAALTMKMGMASFEITFNGWSKEEERGEKESTPLI